MGKKTKEPEYKKLARQRDELQQDLARLEAEKVKIEAEIDKTLLAGDDPGALQGQAATIDQTKQNLSRRLELIERQITELEPARLRDELAEIDRKIEQQARALRKGREEWDGLYTEFRKKEGYYGGLFANLGASIEHLKNKRSDLKNKLTELEPVQDEEELPPPVSEALINEWLNKLRAGKVSSVIVGQDPNLDEASRRYEKEKEEVKNYARMLRIGADPSPPACRRHYSPARFNELVRR